MIKLSQSEYHKQYRIKNKGRLLEYDRSYAQKHKLQRKEKYLLWYQENKNKDSFKKLRNESNRKFCFRKKIECFNHYGNGKIECSCCGEKEIKFLCLDHINGGGNKHRKESKTHGGEKTYIFLAKSGFPTGFQILCANCNLGKHLNGGSCPHVSI